MQYEPIGIGPKPPPRPALDEQLWPINSLLVILSGAVAGLIIGTSDFKTDRWLENGWVRLATLALSMIALLVMAYFIRGPRGRRLQMAALISLAVHAGIGLTIHSNLLDQLELPKPPADGARVAELPTVTQFDYHVRSIDNSAPPQAFERPIETSMPPVPNLATEKPAPIERQTAEQRPIERVVPPTTIAEPQASRAPSAIAKRADVPAAARRAKSESRLSKSERKIESQPASKLDAPEMKVAANPVEAVRADNEGAQRNAAPLPTPRTADAPSTVIVAKTGTQPVRQASDIPQSPAASMASPTLKRAVGIASATPHADSIEPSAVAKVDSTSNAPRPNTNLARSTSAGPIVRAQPSDFIPTTDSTIAGVPAAVRAGGTPQGRDVVPGVAKSAQPGKSTQPGKSAAGSTASAVAGAQPGASAITATGSGVAGQTGTGQSGTGPQATATSTVRGSGSAGPGVPSLGTGGEPAPGAALAGFGRATGSARGQESAPTINPSAAVNGSPARATTAGSQAASPINIESPGIAGTGAVAGTSTPQAGRTGLSRSASGVGILGGGSSENSETGSPAAATNVQVASAASQRSATSATGGGPGVAASQVGAVRRSATAGSTTLSSVVRAEAVPTPDRGGTSHVGSIDAAGGAALARSGSSATRGAISAAAGNQSADTGAMQIVSAGGSGRGDGGGQPTVGIVSSGKQPSRSTLTGTALAAIGSDVVAADPTAPAGTGGGGLKGTGSDNGAPSSRDPKATGSGGTGPGGGLDTQLAAKRSGSGGPGILGFGGSSSEGDAPAGIGPLGGIASSSGANSGDGGPARGDGGQPGVASGVANGALARSSNTGIFVADTVADDIGVESGRQPNGGREGTPLDSNVTSGSRQAAGLPGRSTTGAVGAIAGEMIIDVPTAGGTGTLAGARAISDGGVDGPAVTTVGPGAALRRSSTAGLPGNTAEAIDVPELNGGITDAVASNATAAPGPNLSAGLSISRSGGLPVLIAAATGPGGLGIDFSPVVGSTRNDAQRDSEVVIDSDARFLKRDSGGSGTAAVDGPIRDTARGFERPGVAGGTGTGGNNTKTNDAVERGLDFLVRCQNDDGSWSFHKFPGATKEDVGLIQSDTAATGLVLMTFLGGGYDHFDDKHRETVRRGLLFLREQQKDTGDLYVVQDKKTNESAWLYSHAIGTIALCEAYGMTGDDELREPAQRALQFIEAAQNRQTGGWRYAPGVDADTSVSGWQLMALKSGELAGLKVKTETYEAVRKWLNGAQPSPAEGAQYVYNPFAPSTPDRIGGRKPTPAMSAVGLLMRMYLGWNRENQQLVRGANKLTADLPAIGFTSNPKRDTYYWYYATQVMYHMGGEHWKLWNDKLFLLLNSTQIKTGPMAGSWDPGGRVPDRWGSWGGRIYVTTLNLLSLEVEHRHLPIYQSTAK